jgi:hypothetical protein
VLPPNCAGSERSPERASVSKTCHVANAEGGETRQTDRGGAARSAARTRSCLFYLSEGGGRASTLLSARSGVWRVQTPRDAPSDRDPQGRSARQVVYETTDGGWLGETARVLLDQLERGRDVLGESRSTGCNLGRGDIAEGRGRGLHRPSAQETSKAVLSIVVDTFRCAIKPCFASATLITTCYYF